MNQPEIDAEKLAALMDGRLGERERAELMARLAASDDSLEVLADAAAAVSEAERGEAKVVPLASPRAPRWHLGDRRWLAAAAVIAGIALVGPIVGVWLRTADSDPGRFVALLAAEGSGLPAGWDGSPWSAVRGGEAEPLTPEARAARLGARIVDLELAVRARDTIAARLAGDVAALLQGIPAGAPVAAMYREVAQRSGEPQDVLQPLLRRARIAAGKQAGAELVELGAWAEAARIAAARRDAGFFRGRATRNVIRDALARQSLPQATARSLGELQTALAGEALPEWTALESQVNEVMRLLGR